MKYAKNFENESISQIMVGVGQIYGEFATAEAYSFFDKSFLSNKLKGFDQIGMLNSFTQFLLRQEVESIEKSISVFSFLKENGDFYTKMYLPQFTDYFQKFFDEEIHKLNEEILILEKNKDEVYANQSRQKIKRFEALSDQFEKIGTERK